MMIEQVECIIIHDALLANQIYNSSLRKADGMERYRTRHEEL